MLNDLKAKIKKVILLIKLKCKYKDFNFEIGKNTFISTKAHIILGKNSNLIIGKGCYFSDNVRLIVHDNSSLVFGDNVYVSINTIISSNSKVVIEDDTLIAHNVTILDTNKKYNNVKVRIREQGYIAKEIHIKNDCWISTGAVILPGVKLGSHCIVAANAVVNKQYPKECILGGVPAKIIKRLNEDKDE